MHKKTALVVLVFLAATLPTACAGPDDRAGPATARSQTGPSLSAAEGAGGGASPLGRLYGATGAARNLGAVAFPPRNEPYAFRQELEAKYRDGLGRSPSPTFVDLEGDIVWTQEYVRYRVNGCDHQAAAQRVFDQIDGRGVASVCGDARPGPIAFPPRNEPYAFRLELEAKYRDGLHRPATSSNVDIEGSIVWTQEYLRYRVNRCGHAAAAAKVLSQIDGQGIAPTCWDALSGVWDGESDYFNAPFTMDVYMRGASILGRYSDRHDTGSLWGTYESGPAVVINAYFGDGGIRFDGAFDGPDTIRGSMRVSTLSRLYRFTMTRRP